MPCCSILFYVNTLAFSQPQRSYNHETIRYGACAHVRAINLDPRGRYADGRQIRATTAANYLEHGQHVEHFA
jgi:hypothetical protein